MRAYKPPPHPHKFTSHETVIRPDGSVKYNRSICSTCGKPEFTVAPKPRKKKR